MINGIRYALRMFGKAPGFAAIAVLAVALGIGGATTMFSAFNAILLRPLPLIQEQEQLIFFSQSFPSLGDREGATSFPDYLEFKRQMTTAEGVFTWQEATFIISGGERPERYLGANISADAFAILGVQPVLGRLFLPDEDDPAAPPVALLGYDVWQRMFAGDPDIIGTVLPINGKMATIVGVMPKGWRFPELSDIWMPLQMNERDNPRGDFFLDCIARLKNGVTLKEARAELDAINGRLAAEFPETNAGTAMQVRKYRDEMVRNSKTLTMLVMGSVLFVHLIACANVANLLLARSATRAKEVAIRVALGATRLQIMRQLLVESLLLGLAGSAVGLLFAVWGQDLMLAGVPTEIPYWLRFEFDVRVFAFAGALGVLSSVLFGLVPALQSSKPQLVDALKEGGRTSAGGKAQRMRSALVVAEVALALVLLIGAGLMMRSFQELQRTDFGADPSSTLTFRIGLPESQFPAPDAPRRFFEELVPRLAASPGVEAVGATTSLPAAGNVNAASLVLEGEAEPQHLQDGRIARSLSITPGFLQTARITLLRGRDFTPADNHEAPRVVLIDEVAARQWFPNGDAVGRQLRKLSAAGEAPEWHTIVGVTRPVVFHRILRTQQELPIVYFCAFQQTPRFMSVAMRTNADPKSFAPFARDTVLQVNKDVPIYRVMTQEEVVADSFWDRKFFSSLFTAMAALALFLASIGLYGVMDYSVRQRTQEIGVRIALGAQSSHVLRMVTAHGMRLIGLGLVIGVVSALFLTRLMASSLHGVSARDPLSFIVVPIVLLIVGLLACYIPARHATRLDPVEALRYG
jgi:putative ABC transport system permease protein